MDIIQKEISNFIQSQFPNYYMEHGPLFVKFVETYYRWMQSPNNALYHTRRVLEYKDIDETVESFLIYFKETYLKGIQLDTIEQTRQLVKHSLDLYRSKGTERSIDLFFRAVYGKESRVYYPGSDLFKLSDGKWTIPTYLEISIGDNSELLVDKEIYGLTSNAVAFCERYVRRVINNQLIDVLFISARNGDFMTGELVNSTDNIIPINEAPVITGSLTSLLIDVNGTGEGYEIGDLVDLVSNTGIKGRGRVANTTSTTGLVNFELVDGGYAYTNNSLTLISEKVLTVSNVVMQTSNLDRTYFGFFDTIIQNYANVNYLNSNGTFTVGANLFTYYANNLNKGTGQVISVVESNSTAGEMRISILSGSMNDNAIYTTANAIGANLAVVNGYFSMTATGNVMAESANVLITVANTTIPFVAGEVINQVNANNVVVANATITSFSVLGPIQKITAVNSFGAFHANALIYGQTTNASANVQSISLTIGVKSITGAFLADANVRMYSNTSNTTAVCISVSTGTGASINVSTDRIYTENVVLDNNFVSGFLSVALNANTYGLNGNATANLTNMAIANALNYQQYTIGTVNAIVSYSPGEDYNAKPFVRLYEPMTYAFFENDGVLITISNTSGSFSEGELLYQGNTSIKGLLLSTVNSSSLYVRRLNLYDNASFTANSTVITGVQSGTTALIANLTSNVDSKFMGDDAVISANLIASNGAVSSIEIVDSGFNYINGDQITFTLNGVTGTATGVSTTQGHGAGFYQSRGGFLSDTKKLYDGEYWQNYSYEIQSSLNLDKYSEMLKHVLHPVGTKAFSAIYYIAPTSVESTFKSATITVT